jgi:hypothetical protein
MAHIPRARLVVMVVSSFVLGAPAFGCGPDVVGSVGSDGGGGSGGSGGGGPSSSVSTSSTPLVLSFDGAPVEYLADRERSFDLDGRRSQVTDWPSARTPWLALDRDGNGRIDDGGELFGSMSVLPGGGRAPNGFVALRALDADGDGRITADDPGFSRLLVWSDRDGDRRSTAGELAPASSWELISLDLDYVVDPRCDARGNCEVERASFRYRDSSGVERTGAIVDVHLASQR